VDWKGLLPLLHLTSFMLAALILVALTIVWPARRWTKLRAEARIVRGSLAVLPRAQACSQEVPVSPTYRPAAHSPSQSRSDGFGLRAAGRPVQGSAPLGIIIYFISIGLGFMLAEMGMMQQLSIFLGQPIYSLAVVLAGLILSAGLGSLASDRMRMSCALKSRVPALSSGLVLVVYSLVVLPAIHGAVAGVLWQRIAVSLGLVTPCGFVMGFCFPVGLRWAKEIGQEGNLPWMWALNGAASVLGSFMAIGISMESTIRGCVLTGAAGYALAGILMSGRAGSGSTDRLLAGYERSPEPILLQGGSTDSS
jgi:hypothetical protein